MKTGLIWVRFSLEEMKYLIFSWLWFRGKAQSPEISGKERVRGWRCCDNKRGIAQIEKKYFDIS